MMSTSHYYITRQTSPDAYKVERPVLDASLLGRFVRKCRLEYMQLEFEGQGQLWALFKSARSSLNGTGTLSPTSSRKKADIFIFPDIRSSDELGKGPIGSSCDNCTKSRLHLRR